MSRNEKDLSDYLGYLSAASQILAVIAGFIFTAITLLVTLLPDPSQLAAQATLFSLTVVFGLCLLLVNRGFYIMGYCIRVFPPLPEGYKRGTDYLNNLIWFILGIPIILMFLLWNLTYLALATAIVEALFNILGYIGNSSLDEPRRKFEAETKKKWTIRKFFDERDIIFESED